MSNLSRRVRSSRSWQSSRPRKAPPTWRPAATRRAPAPLWPLRAAPRHFFRRLFWTGLVLTVFGALFLTSTIAILSRNLPEPGRLIERAVPISTKIYDREGKVLLYDIHGDIKRTPISLDKIAPTAKWAAIVAEDRDFYTHEGFRLQSILRAFFVNLTHLGVAQGGSTITQQFVKNAVLTNEKTLTRKLKELVLAYKIEKRFSKDEILNMYFNEIPYGSTTYGIEAAAQSFFGKSAAELNTVEAAMLAAIPKSPTRLSPYGAHTDELVARTRYIVSALRDSEYISAAEAENALKEDPLSRIKPKRDNILAPHFVLYVRDQLAEKYGEDFVERGGLKVITTLDWRLQQIAEEEILNGAKRNEKQYNAKNAALLAEDPKTGQLLAMVGSRDYFDETVDGNVNVVLRARQPGSSIKPIVYAAAFKKGFTPDTPLWDILTIFKVEPKDYEPRNYDDKEHGLVTMRTALAGSLNIPAVKTLYLTGVDNVLDLADALGYTTLTDRSRFGLSLTLGGGEVKLLDHVGAFSVLANGGKKLNQSTILRVENSSGRILEEWQPPSELRVLDSAVVADVVSIMADNDARSFIFGARSALVFNDRPIAAKTGTTNDWRDGWTMGFTPALVAGVWAGNNDNTAMKKRADGVLVAAPIWNAFMSRALKGAPVENFSARETRTIVNPYLRGEIMPIPITVKVNKQNGKLASSITPALDIEERAYLDAHSELYYLNKDALDNTAPSTASTDPNFPNFEEALRKYTATNHLFLGLPPTEMDTMDLAPLPTP